MEFDHLIFFDLFSLAPRALMAFECDVDDFGPLPDPFADSDEPVPAHLLPSPEDRATPAILVQVFDHQCRRLISEHSITKECFSDKNTWHTIVEFAQNRTISRVLPTSFVGRSVGGIIGLTVCECGDPDCARAFRGAPSQAAMINRAELDLGKLSYTVAQLSLFTSL